MTTKSAAKAPDRDLAFVFDLAGVLLEWNPDIVYKELCLETGRDSAEFFANVFDNAVQNSISAGQPIRKVLDQLANQHPDWRREIFVWLERWDEMLTGKIGGAVSALGELRERGHATYALGNWSREEFDRTLPRFEFLAEFTDVLLSGDCGILKPDDRIYALAERQFNLITEKTIFIDDKRANVEAALKRNWNGILFENPRQLYLTLMEYGIL